MTWRSTEAALLVIGLTLAGCTPGGSSPREKALAAIDRFSHARAVTVILDIRGEDPGGKSTVTLTQASGRPLHTERGDCDSLPSCTPLIFGEVPTMLRTVAETDAPQGAVELDQSGNSWAGWGGSDWHIVIDTAGDPIETGTSCGSHCDFYLYTMGEYQP